jgi:hypothetical protein
MGRQNIRPVPQCGKGALFGSDSVFSDNGRSPSELARNSETLQL